MFDEDSGPSFFKINNLINGTETLTDKYDIENVILAIQQMNKKVDFLKELKKRRNQAIDEQVATEEQGIEKLETAIKNCMTLNKDKSLDFPGVAKVTVRSVKGTWTVLDEDGLKKHLASLNKLDDVVETVEKIKKKELNKILDELKANNNTSSFVQKEDDKMSLSISYTKENVSQPQKTDSINVPAQQFDKLEI